LIFTNRTTRFLWTRAIVCIVLRTVFQATDPKEHSSQLKCFIHEVPIVIDQ